ncbi:hypothetical protein KAU11_10045, partial [Candidatus Babeliales bacterium]|nr:hypothetical protein [Candidatus Babeliales bacterium]
MTHLYKLSLKLIVLLITIIVVSSNSIYSQNIAITDDDGYAADPTAMLDVMSTDKGMLVPRMTTAERLLIGLPGAPAIGLLVYDTDFNNFFYYNGLTWMSLPQLDVSGFGGPLFHVVNSYGDTIFAVYDDGVEIIIPTGVKGKVGGFAVSGRSPSKGDTDDYLLITPDSARIYINDTVSAKGSVGGFAVSGRSPSKGTVNNIFLATVDSTRIYVDEAGAKGSVGGFAVSGRSPSKATTGSFLSLSSKNYFIGRNSGVNNTTGEYNFFAGDSSGYRNTVGSKNIFLGYASGLSNIGEGLAFGSHNIFIGYQAGYNNEIGFNNIFLGYQAGYMNLGGIGEEGSFNTFIGYETGYKSQIGGSNTFLGYQAGFENHQGNHNTYLGRWSGAENTDGSYNVFVGTEAGRYEMGSNKLCINAVNIPAYTPPLIYGEFDNRNIVIDGDANDNPVGEYKLVVTGRAGAVEFVNLGKKSELKSEKELNSSLDKILQLNGISYTKTDEKGEMSDHIGIDPETAVKIIPEIVKDYGDMYGIEYAKLSVLLIEAVKEQQKQIEELQKLIKIKNIELEES